MKTINYKMKKVHIIYIMFVTAVAGCLSVIKVSEAATSVSVCGTLSQASETYTLTDDLTATGTCLTVTASNVTIDLNGHTITYGTGGAAQVYGVRTGWANNGLRVTNGTIRQSQSAGSFAHAIYASSGSYDQFDNLTLEVYTDSTAAIVALYGTGHQVHHNTVTSHVQTIQDRHMNQGYVIQFWDGGSNDVHDNTIVGGAQGGIFFYHNNNTRVYDNDISQGGQSIGYSNDFCIGGSGDNAEVYGNNCHPIQGRGIHIGGNNAKAYNNTINVIELANNAEYGGCQAGGTYGIQIENPATNLQIYNNTVIARADACAAQAFRATELAAGSNCRVYNNTFTAQRVGAGTGIANAVSVVSVEAGLTIESNTLTGDSANFHVDWDGANGVVLAGNTVVKGSNPSAQYTTINFGNGGSYPSLGNVLRDSVYQNGADDASYIVRSAAYEYYIQWTLTLTVKDQSGAALARANVGVYDSQGTTVFSGQTDNAGIATIPLSEYRRYNQAGTNHVQQLTPHTVTVTKNYYDPQSSSITMDQGRSINVELSGGPPDSSAPAATTDLLAQ